MGIPRFTRLPLSGGGETVVDTLDVVDFKLRERSIRLLRSGRDKQKSYAFIKLNGKDVPLHRLLMGFPEGMEVDHINGDGLDNRRSRNLRTATKALNMANAKKCRKQTHSKWKGVSRDRLGGWVAYIIPNGKQIHLGRFKTEEEAARAYDVAAVLEWGEYARTNFPVDFTF